MANEFSLSITGRHLELTDSIRSYAEKRIRQISMEYPRIIEAKVIVDAQPHGHIAEIVLYCSDHVTIQAQTETGNLYEAIDLTVSKVERQMRKQKTKRLKKQGR
jgi:putative sigma-54 modulation protein